MIAQITPLVQVASRNTWLKASASHVLGSTLIDEKLSIRCYKYSLSDGAHAVPALGWVPVRIFMHFSTTKDRAHTWVAPLQILGFKTYAMV